MQVQDCLSLLPVSSQHPVADKQESTTAYLGALIGYLACLALARYHFIDLPEGVFYVSTLPVRIVASNFVLVSVASVTICLGACVFPAWKASRVVPVDVLRYE